MINTLRPLKSKQIFPIPISDKPVNRSIINPLVVFSLVFQAMMHVETITTTKGFSVFFVNLFCVHKDITKYVA